MTLYEFWILVLTVILVILTALTLYYIWRTYQRGDSQKQDEE